MVERSETEIIAKVLFAGYSGCDKSEQHTATILPAIQRV